ncbi:16S rRNA (guanine(527)-N(7))-methyltransferase RsmG [Orbaceae bacterium ESL0721]|nr:16S rRNA (guanine(527)-N(7))-methyltransferase RsmG [Orbaceae bacterium ESL0721]
MLKKRLTDLINQTDPVIKGSITETQIDLLIRYVKMLDRWNRAYNLTAIRDPKEMLIKHIMDSIVISPHLKGETFIDVGTGPGLPGVPLAIINPDNQFDLVDSLGKRIRFLKQVQFELKLDNINPQQSRIEAYTAKQFDGVISRAFASLNDMLTWCRHLPNDEGLFYALKGVESDPLPNGFTIIETLPLQIPELDATRRLVIIKPN